MDKAELAGGCFAALPVGALATLVVRPLHTAISFADRCALSDKIVSVVSGSVCG